MVQIDAHPGHGIRVGLVDAVQHLRGDVPGLRSIKHPLPTQTPIQNEVNALLLGVGFEVPAKGIREHRLHVLLGHKHVLLGCTLHGAQSVLQLQDSRLGDVQFILRSLSTLSVFKQFLRFFLKRQRVLLQLLLSRFQLQLEVGLHGLEKGHALLKAVSMNVCHDRSDT